MNASVPKQRNEKLSGSFVSTVIRVHNRKAESVLYEMNWHSSCTSTRFASKSEQGGLSAKDAASGGSEPAAVVQKQEMKE